MDAVTILNNYRLALVSDAEAIRILSILFRLGPQSEIQLKENSKAGLKKLRVKLTELYRAHLICFVADERWATTDLADQILTRLGVAEVAAKSLLEEQDIKESDKSFLEACLTLRSSHDNSWSRYQTAVLRTLANLERHAWVDLHGSGNELRHLLYGVIVGLDTDAQQLGGADYCNFVIKWHNDKDSDLWNRWGGHWLEDQEIFQSRCDAGVKLVFDSNALLTSSERATPRKRLSRLTLLRILSAIVSETADASMGAAFRFNPSLSDDTWEVLARTFPDLETRVGKVLLDWGKDKPKQAASWAQKLRTLLDEILWQDPNSHLSLPLMASGDTHKALTPVRGAWLEGTLLRIKAQIDAGDYDRLPSESKIRLLGLLEETRSTFMDRASSEVLDAGQISDAEANQGATPDVNHASRGRRR